MTEPPHHGQATVVISRHVAPGREREFQRWLGRLRRAVEAAPGYAGSSFHPPQADHPDEWLIVYRFVDVDHLDLWLASPTRRELVDQGQALIVGEPREQRLAEPSAGSLTLVSSIQLRPGTEPAFRALHERGVAAARRLGGLVRAELLPAVPGAQPETVALLTFATHDDLDRWLESDERRATLEAMAPYAEGSRTTNVVGGFGGWFGPSAGKQPRRWKQAVAVILALVPVSIAITAVRLAVAPGLPPMVGVGIGAAINVVVLTWVVMPWLTRALGPWLSR